MLVSQLMNEPSEMTSGESAVYKRKYLMLSQRCQELQKDNENVVHRIQEIRKLLKRFRKDRKLLITRLDQYNDGWRTVQTLPFTPNVQPQLSRPPPERLSESARTSATIVKLATNQMDKAKNRAGGSKGAAPTKRKGKVDPLAPKRPANPFFQFCQEQRPIITEQVVGEGHEDVSKQELTRLLANRWKTLSTENKKIYYEMYERQKEKYAVDMQIYESKAGLNNLVLKD